MSFDDPSMRHNGAGRGSGGVARLLKSCVRAAVVAVAAMGMLAAPAMAQSGGAGSGSGSVGMGGDAELAWTYKEDYGAPTVDNVKAAMNEATPGIWIGPIGANNPDTPIRQALTSAVSECQARGNQECRLVGVGYVHSITPSSSFTGAAMGATQAQWLQPYTQYVQPGTYYRNGVAYNTAALFNDGVTSIDSLVARETANDPANKSVIVIVLGENEPPTVVPPEPPAKGIEEGVSADSMTNRTVISTGTGKGGTKMTIGDRFTPDGQTYTVSDLKVTDKTAGEDITGSFTFSTQNGQTPAGDHLTATWNGGDLPDSHTFELSFQVTVSDPEISKVGDQGYVRWNDEPEQTTDRHEFPTWKPNPDKSWIVRDGDGGWAAVIDPQETNATGGDAHKFLDGDEVASVVNGTVDAGLIDVPESLTLTDDWTAADYIWDGPTGADQIRVFAADATSDSESSVADIVNNGGDVTDQFDIAVQGTKATATAKASYLKGLKGMKNPKQVTLLIPGRINFANGGGAEQVREDFSKEPGSELTFCAAPDASGDPSDTTLTNSGSETVNGQSVPTNTPYICGYIPPVEKDVLSEASEGGEQESVDGKAVFPGQKVEYQLLTTPNLPADLAYGVSKVVFTDSFDQRLEPDKQTVEMMDLSDGKVIAKSKYSTEWDDEQHLFQLTVTDQELIARWRAGSSPRIQVRFEGTVSEDAPVDHQVNNQWMLTLNNSLTPSNEVFNVPPDFNPGKEDNQSEAQGDPTVSIDGRTLLMGDTGNYVVSLDLTQRDQAYKVWRAGIVDDFDDGYLKIDPQDVEVLDAAGQDVTDRFNVAIRDGVAYVFAKTVDTGIPATGETVKGDPQPSDLKAYSELTDEDYDPLKDPSIDQSLLGQTYRVVLPYTVVKAADGYVVENTATQIVNDLSKQTNTVSNPLKPINPVKDVTVEVGGDSANGQSVYLNSTFLYQLDSSVIPADRAYPEVIEWGIVDQLDPQVDALTGQWAVYAARDLYRDGQVIAARGAMIAGGGFDSSKLGGDMFTANIDQSTGKVTIESTDLYRSLAGADTAHEQAWRAYIQCRRVKVVDRHENRFTEHFNDKDLESNVVWTKTPDMTPSLSIEKWDETSGWPDGDRDTPQEALEGAKDGDVIVFTITNTSKTDDEGNGAWFKASDLKLEDETIVGDGEVTDLVYPVDWGTLVLRPGDSVDVRGTLTGFTADRHTDRAQVTGIPLVTCPVSDDDPFGTNPGDGSGGQDGPNTVEIDGTVLCEDTVVESNTDDWNATSKLLATTGSSVMWIAGGALVLFALGGGLVVVRRRGAGSHAAHTAKTAGRA
ncbi:LPXTG cell wall anchor domain-containing protein [Bifidobacterium tsurumiense]|uniref:Adhesin isopeptide-forming adherence domain protein n=1 Tax=Bifidobacterium tsurumiense TaxID=356829 RepID=A0A087EBE5_9BIFI|nr:LPXTG cell wall anchor domain-containing protein [Bifidobacterium tsurumiense]KFJ05096.1 adhesin isopeptide-forming adherence domain protein [Bifidobacterium tsurumiense]